MGPEESTDPVRLRDVRELRIAGATGVLVLLGFLVPLLGGALATGSGVATHLAAAALGGSTFVPGAVRGLRRRRVGVATLMTIALLGALVLGQVAEAAMLAFLFSISEALEDYSVTRARRGLRSLLALVPTEVAVERNGRTERIPASALDVGDLMVVMAGDRVASDGVVRGGRSTLDVSAITGESMPAEVGPGDAVHAGSVNANGVLRVEATARVEDNSLARVVAVVEDAQRLKGDRQRIADRIARPLVPAIMVAAALIAAVGSLLGDPTLWVERALVVLVAAAPCALALSVPVTVVAAVGAASRFGVLVKGGAAIEALGAVRTVALDKTGTLTANRPRVIEVVATPRSTQDEVLATAAALERHSEHPLAAAVLTAAAEGAAAPRDATDVEAVPGHGLRGLLDGRPARLGKPTWVLPGTLASEVDRLQASGATVAVVEVDGEVAGVIAVRDELRPEAAEVVADLRARGIDVVMLTGDHERTARAIAAELGITRVHADLVPTDKSDLVARLRRQSGRPVAMVGDGVNDAPALAVADVGIAMGAMGADVAIEAADVALMGSDLRHLPQAIGHARRARRIMLQNIALSLLIVVGLVPLAALGVLGLATVVLIHEVAEVFVIANAVRAGRLAALDGADAPPATDPGRDLGAVQVAEDGCACCAPSADVPVQGIGTAARGA
ncbi:heavy metal translocating P-type ATPase [Nocardioides kribbensis]|uniref:Cation-translocating P-type ATPase n=1 Tax=Nocardioides kribbensis TaxID=305517 RepID=A0ABV1NT77_9ACTN